MRPDEIRARLRDAAMSDRGDWWTYLEGIDFAALERDLSDMERLIDVAGDWIETDPSLRSTACIEVALDHAKELEAEVERLRGVEQDMAVKATKEAVKMIADQLAEVRRVVEEERDRWHRVSADHANYKPAQLACDEILARLEKL